MWVWEYRFPTSVDTGSTAHSACERSYLGKTLILMERADDLLLFERERVVCVITREYQEEEMQ
jgi:hypothetical protein